TATAGSVLGSSFRLFSFSITRQNMLNIIRDLNLNTSLDEIEVEHFNFSPEFSRGQLDDAFLGMSFNNLQVYQLLPETN
ncbi:MAG: hypothetical protein EBQ85_00135, partial [Proteobacteria bacterium]|nr:hypothetical protein [Pseudomonadota bacterium]